MNTETKTWLPVFSGFYGTIWETDNDEEMEIENINDQRASKGLPPIEWDAIEWDYKGYTESVGKGFTKYVERDLKGLGVVDKITYEKVSSPREYNFANDSIHIEVGLTKVNEKNIRAYLRKHKDAFKKYLEDHYTSYDGFMSSYSNNVEVWLVDDYLTHEHKLGAVLNFILLNEDDDYEMEVYEDLHGNGVFLTATNYKELEGV